MTDVAGELDRVRTLLELDLDRRNLDQFLRRKPGSSEPD